MGGNPPIRTHKSTARGRRAPCPQSLPRDDAFVLSGTLAGHLFSWRKMTARVHPNTSVASRRGKAPSPAPPPDAGGSETEVQLTVWRKSLLFNCDGFTVFDANGNLVFRVDNYASGHRGEVVLMDATGNPLLTIRRKKLSLGDHWLVYQGEEATDPRFSVKKHVNFRQSKSLAHVTACSAAGRCTYEVEGSYSQRCCSIYDERRQQLAEIRRKETASGVGFGADVFRLVVQPGFEEATAMAIVILLDQMFGSRGH